VYLLKKQAAVFEMLYACELKNIKTTEKVQKVYFGDVPNFKTKRN
jgi:hypothetical protein